MCTTIVTKHTARKRQYLYNFGQFPCAYKFPIKIIHARREAWSTNEEILEEAKVEHEKGRVECFEHTQRRDEIDNITAVEEIKLEEAP